MSFHAPHSLRVREGALSSDDSIGNNGAFIVPTNTGILFVICSDQEGWEHVSVSRKDKKTPSWEEMCVIKNIFWDEEDVVVQYHPRKSDYVNNHPGCLHLWRQVGKEFDCPPSYMVGVK